MFAGRPLGKDLPSVRAITNRRSQLGNKSETGRLPVVDRGVPEFSGRRKADVRKAAPRPLVFAALACIQRAAACVVDSRFRQSVPPRLYASGTQPNIPPETEVRLRSFLSPGSWPMTQPPQVGSASKQRVAFAHETGDGLRARDAGARAVHISCELVEGP